MLQIVGFNGPPHCGKDTAATAFADYLGKRSMLPIIIWPLNKPLREIAYAMAGWQGHQMWGPDYESFKAAVHEPYGVTGRQLMIDVSEAFLKRRYGEAIMARLWRTGLQEIGFDGVVLIPDCGFPIEVEALLPCGPVAVFKIYREGCHFLDDSRNYLPDIMVDGSLINGDSLEKFKAQAPGEIYDHLTRSLGWVF